MEQKRIPIKGINRSFDDGISDDGCCMELINARITNGSVEPIGAPVELTALPSNTKKVYYHQQAMRYLIIFQDGSVSAYSVNTYELEQNLSVELTGVNRIEFIGNVAVFFFTTTTRYCIFKDGIYKYLGEKPDVPQVMAEPFAKSFSVCPDTNFLIADREQGLTSDEFYASFAYAASGMYDNCIDSANKEGHFFGSLFIVAALRMYDGSYCAFGPISFIEADNDVEFKFGFGGETNTSSRSVTLNRWLPIVSQNKTIKTGKFYDKCEAVVYAMNPNIRLVHTATSLSAWKDIITAIDIFVCPVSFCVKEEVKNRGGISYDSYKIYRKNKTKLIEIIEKATVFHRYAEYDLDLNLQWMLEDVSTDSLALQDTISFSNMDYPVGAYLTYVYNNRIHVADYRTYFPNRNLLDLRDNIYEKEYSDEREVRFYFYIRTDEANSIILGRTHHSFSSIAPYIMYYDNRAYKVLVAWKDAETGVWYGKEFPLTKSKTINMAYYMHFVTITDGRYGSASYDDLSTSIDLTEFPEITSLPSEQNTFVMKKNIMKVSRLSNPFVFPAAQTYQPSQASIVGFCSNTQALSQGQFGQHPLYVFTRDGIYAMGVDTSGSIVYSTQTPVSRDVCINEQSIRGIDSSVLFATNQGLMSISGSGVRRLSDDIDGYLPSCFNSSPILNKVASVASLDNCVSKVELKDYLDISLSVNVAYIYASREIIVSNSAYTYSYLYNIDSATWSKVDYSIAYLTNRYPETYAVLRHADGSLHLKDLYNPHRTVSKMLLLTKPIKLGTNSHKRILQSALRAILHPAKSDIYFRGEPVMFRNENVDIFSDVGLYILGSNDAEYFELVSGKESINDVRDLVSKMNKSRAYKYFMIALAGGVRTDVAINYMEFLVDDAYTNRLR